MEPSLLAAIKTEFNDNDLSCSNENNGLTRDPSVFSNEMTEMINEVTFDASVEKKAFGSV